MIFLPDVSRFECGETFIYKHYVRSTQPREWKYGKFLKGYGARLCNGLMEWNGMG